MPGHGSIAHVQIEAAHDLPHNNWRVQPVLHIAESPLPAQRAHRRWGRGPLNTFHHTTDYDPLLPSVYYN